MVASPDSDFPPTLIPKITSTNEGRKSLTRSLLIKLGLKLNDLSGEKVALQEYLEPSISSMFLLSPDEQIIQDFVSKFPEKTIQDSYHTFIIKDDCIQGPSKSLKDINICYNKKVVECGSFDVNRYINLLSDKKSDFGKMILFGLTVEATQTILEKYFQFYFFITVVSIRNTKLQSYLPLGTTCITNHQLHGRGRGTNSWISQQGCLQFSFLIRHMDFATVVFVQYLVGLSFIASLKKKVGYEVKQINVFTHFLLL